MNMNTNIFLNKDKNLGPLYLDMVLVEATRPLFFTCIDNNDRMYACSCHCADGEKCQWVVVPTTCEKMIEVLTDRITIRDVFDGSDEDVFLVTLYAGASRKVVEQVNLSQLPEDILPTPGYYMEAEEGEFDEEIAELRNRQENAGIVIHNVKSFFASCQFFSIQVKLPVISLAETKFMEEDSRDYCLPVAVGV